METYIEVSIEASILTTNMNQNSSLYVFLKVIFIIAFLPFVLIWYAWKKNDWSKRNKWLATVGVVVLFGFILIPSEENNNSRNKPENPTVKTEAQEKSGSENDAKTEAEPKEKTADEKTEVQGEKAKVTNVVDGDTIKLDNGKVVRYIGIDTPETVHPSKPVQCFGKEASAKNKELVEGKEVTLVKDVSETDKYGRILRYVYVGDIFINDYLVRNGYANSSSYPPDIKYQEQFRKAEEEARNNKRGLWADDACKSESSSSSPAVVPTVPVNTRPSDSYTCNCSKTCPQMSSCAEAQYQLNVCGCSKRDADKDGIACDADCQ